MRVIGLSVGLVVWLAATLGGCAKGQSDCETEICEACLVGEQRCDHGRTQSCSDGGVWSTPEVCDPGFRCERGYCRETCTDACTVGETSCSPQGSQTCVRSDEGCGIWGAPRPCPAGQACREGACRSDCAQNCSDGEGRCVSAEELVSCDASGPCPAFTPPVTCPAGQLCSAGACRDPGACVDGCMADTVSCLDAQSLQRCVRSAEGCLEWSDPEPCAAGEACRPGSGCASQCNDPCDLGGRRCADRGYQLCAADASGCAVWGAIEACPEGEACREGACQDACQDACALGDKRCDANGQVETCVPEGRCAVWGAPVGCPGGAGCSGAGQCGECAPAATQTRDCGRCGSQSQTCGGDGLWGGWGGCGGEGECQPGDTEACGGCGRRTCGDDCRWGACDGGGECQPGDTEACGQCGHRSCSAQCRWEACNNGDGTTWRRCNDCGWQFCCPSGDWCNCAARFSCDQGQCVGAGVCQ